MEEIISAHCKPVHMLNILKLSGALYQKSFRSVKFPSVIVHFSSKTYYDSQSGTYIPIPGMGHFSLNDVTLKSTILKHINNPNVNIIQEHISGAGMFSTTINTGIFNNIIGSACFKSSSMACLIGSKEDMKCKHVQDSLSSFLEFDCLSLLSHLQQDTKQIDSVEKIEGLMTEIQHNVRVNLYLDISSLLNNESSGASSLPVVMDVVSCVARLCDAGVSVVNIVLCSKLPQRKALESVSSDQIDDLVCFTREVLEECIGLDVVGAAVMDRLSLQGAPMEVNEMAADLGVVRFSVKNEQLLCGLAEEVQNACQESEALRDISVQVGERQLYCLTSDVSEVLPLAKWRNRE